MHKKFMFRMTVVVAFVSAAGCVTAAISDYPQPDISTLASRMPAISYEVVSVLDDGDPEDSPEEKQRAEGIVFDGLKRSGAFSSIEFQPQAQRLHLRVTVNVDAPPKALAFTTTVLLAPTLWVIPAYGGTLNYNFTFEVTRNAQVLKTYSYEGPTMTLWFGWLAPYIGDAEIFDAPSEASAFVCRRLAADLEKDGFLAPAR